MADEKSEKNKGGKGKFLLGATFGAIAGAIAGHFLSKKMKEAAEEDLCDCDDCECGEKCDCKDKKKSSKEKDVVVEE